MKLNHLVCALTLLPLLASASAAENSPQNAGKTSAQLKNSKIDTWVEGTIKSVDTNGQTLVVNGVILPVATAHAQIEPDFQQKLANAKEDQKKTIADEFKKDLKDCVTKIDNEKAAKSAQDFKLKAAPANEMLVLNQEAVGEIISLRRENSGKAEKGKPEWRGEEDVIGIYEAPQNVNYNSDKSKNTVMNDLKDGDKVMVGFNSKSNETYSVIREMQK